MKRTYSDGTLDSVEFFLGREVEHTPAHGLITLFVTGVQSVEDIDHHITHNPAGIEHIFFGANHSYNPTTGAEHAEWENMIRYFLDKGYLCSLDIPFNQVEEFNDGGLCEHNNFIPQIRIPIPYVSLWNYNTMIKIDDRDFNATNPGVWSHSLHDLMQRDRFTDWRAYSDDVPLQLKNND